MLTSYLLPLLAVVLLCACWAGFQIWLSRHDPDAKARSLKCGGCGRKDDCNSAGDPSV